MREFCPKATFGSRFRQVAYSKQVAGKNPAIWRKKTGSGVRDQGLRFGEKDKKDKKDAKNKKGSKTRNPEPGTRNPEPGTLTGITH